MALYKIKFDTLVLDAWIIIHVLYYFIPKLKEIYKRCFKYYKNATMIVSHSKYLKKHFITRMLPISASKSNINEKLFLLNQKKVNIISMQYVSHAFC